MRTIFRGENMMKDHTCRDQVGPGERTRRFLRDDLGAVTVDWIVLTGMIVLLGMAAGFAVTANIPQLAGEVGDYMSETTIGVD